VRVLGLDIGEKRIGVAISDPQGRIATPLLVIDAVAAQRDGEQLSRIVSDYEVGLVVVGLPLSLDGEEGPQARRVRTIAGRVADFLPVPVDYSDERFSSAEAKRHLRECGETDRTMRGSVDMVAASILLQAYLDGRPPTGGDESKANGADS